MASDSQRNKFTVSFFTFALFASQVSLAYSSLSLLTDGEVTQRPVKGLIRNRRQTCLDGTYSHEGRTCCLCGAGRRLESHCPVGSQNSKCELCDLGTYSSHPNKQWRCEPCTSCEHPNANLEEVESCTSARDAKCRCKKGYVCPSGTETCTHCHSCKECGAEGVKVACTATNDTVCNDTARGSNDGAIVGGVIGAFVLLTLIGLGLWFFLRRRRLCLRQNPAAQSNDTVPEVELLTFKALDQHHQHDIARILGWKDMKEVAMRTGTSKTDIENCRQNDQGDAEEQTVQLLGKYVEKHGRSASKTLIEALWKSGKTGKAEKVTELLRRDDDDDV